MTKNKLKIKHLRKLLLHLRRKSTKRGKKRKSRKQRGRGIWSDIQNAFKYPQTLNING